MAYKVGIVGNGWRAHTFLKICEELPRIFKFGGMLFRNEEKARAFSKKYAKMAFTDYNKFYEEEFDFVIVAVSRNATLKHCKQAMERGVPVLCETPPGDGEEELIEILRLKRKLGAKVQVLEQYFKQPYHSALQEFIKSGKMGEVSNVTLSMIHDYHAISMLRKYLGVGFENCTVKAEIYKFPVTETAGLSGLTRDGEVQMAEHKRAVFKFDSGKVGFYNFAGTQYFNYLRKRHAKIQGVRGEISDLDFCYLSDENLPVEATLKRHNLGEFSNLEGYSLRGLSLNGEYLYKNPYEAQRFNDDEIAIASIMEGMGKYVKGGEEIYPLEEAIWDTYLYLCMDKSVETGESVEIINFINEEKI